MRMPCKETFVPYFENTESLFLHKNDTKLEFLELSIYCNHVVSLSRLLMDLKRI